jgi:plasmid stability protein
MDLTDPEFHRPALAHARAVQTEIRALLHAAVDAGELSPCNTEELARAVQVTFNGALVTWAIYREGPLEEWLGHHVAALLKPFRSSDRPPAGPGTRHVR